MKLQITLLLSVLIYNVDISIAQIPGSLDTTFNNTGIVTLAPGTLHDVIYGIAVQSDSKIVFSGVGRITSPSGFTSDLVVGRLNPNGSLDTSFGNNGYFNLPGVGGSAYGYDVKLQPDGKVVVCGGYSISSVDVDFVALRLNTDGSPDSTFGGGNGYSVIPVNTSEDYAYALHIRDDGKIVLAGSSKVPGFTYKKGVVLRLNSNGTVDTTFGNMGNTQFQLNASSSETFRCLDVTAGENIIVAGYSFQSNAESFIMAGFTENGLLDSSFATNGSYFGTFSYAYDLVIDGNQVYTGGKTSGGAGNDIAIMSFDTLGVVNTSWGLNGILIADYNPIDICLALAVQPDGKVLVGGTSGQGSLGNRNFIASRYSATGVLDATFGNAGYIIHSPGPSFNDANALALQADGKILLGGFAALSNNDMVIMRLNNDLSTGVAPIPPAVTWSAYPVPVRGSELYFNGKISSATPILISVMDLAGRIICELTTAMENENTPLKVTLPANLVAGNYIAQIMSGNQVSRVSFIKL